MARPVSVEHEARRYAKAVAAGSVKESVALKWFASKGFTPEEAAEIISNERKAYAPRKGRTRE